MIFEYIDAKKLQYQAFFVNRIEKDNRTFLCKLQYEIAKSCKNRDDIYKFYISDID